MQVLLWHGTTAFIHGKGGPEATLRRNEHHHINVSERSDSNIIDFSVSVFSHIQSQRADTARSINDILSVHKEIVSASLV